MIYHTNPRLHPRLITWRGALARFVVCAVLKEWEE